MDILNLVHSYLDIGFNILNCSKSTRNFSILHYDWKFISRNQPDELIIKKFPHCIIYKELHKEKSENIYTEELDVFNTDNINVSKYIDINTFTTKELDMEEIEIIPREYLNLILMFQKVDENFIQKRLPFTETEWDILFNFQTLSEEFLEQYKEKWTNSMWKSQNLSENFINKHFSSIPSITFILENQKVSENFISKYLHEISDIKSIYIKQELSDEFYERYQWNPFSIHKKTSDELIKKYVHILDINTFLISKKHSESLLEFVIDNVKMNNEQWNILWLFQSVSENFVLKYKDYIFDKHIVMWSQNVSIKLVNDLNWI